MGKRVFPTKLWRTSINIGSNLLLKKLIFSGTESTFPASLIADERLPGPCRDVMMSFA